jgi:hypothetical protein
MRMRTHSLRFAALLSSAALLAGAALALGAAGVGAQAPPSVPQFRAYGTVTINGAPAPAGTTVTAQSASSNTICGTGTVSSTSGSYFVDVQSIAGCTGNVIFLVNGQPTNAGTVTQPNVQGSPKQVNLAVVPATATPTPPPPPAVVATTAPPPPPPPPPPTVAATTAPPPPPPPPTAVPTVAPTVVVPVSPPNTGVGPGPSRTGGTTVQQAPTAKQAPSGPVIAQAPAAASAPVTAAGGSQAVSQAPASVAAAPKLPNTGTGGLLDQQTQSDSSAWLVAGIALALLLLASTATLARRRAR